MRVNLAVLPGDDVGSVVTTQGLNVFQAVGERFGHRFKFNEGLGGGVAIDTPDKALSYETLCVVVGYAKSELDR
jgi:3-isopropylmalate dehydrogenase